MRIMIRLSFAPSPSAQNKHQQKPEESYKASGQGTSQRQSTGMRGKMFAKQAAVNQASFKRDAVSL